MILFRRLANNRLIGNIPDFSDLHKLVRLHLDGNKFSYDEIAAIYNSNSFDDFRYSPQYHGEVQSHIVELDTTLTLELSTPMPGNNNQNFNYQWQKNDDILIVAIDSTYTINNLQLSNVGKYTLHANDTTRIPDLEIISEPIYVIIPEYDLYGQRVAYNQIIMEFDNEADKLKYEEKYVRPIERPDLAAKIVGSCDCNRLLYLWDFPNDSIALEAFLEVNTKRERVRKRRPKAEGGFNNIFNVGLTAPGEGWTWSGSYLDIGMPRPTFSTLPQ